MARSILHVVESFGGGVADAVCSYARAADGYEHHLLYALREGIAVSEEIFEPFATMAELPDGHVARIAATRASVRASDPWAVHAHSSYAGVYVRAAVSGRRTPIVYTPHCFSFERKDISRAQSRVFRSIERALVGNTTAFAACSQREAELARSLSPRANATIIPNIARMTVPGEDVESGGSGAPVVRPIVAMIGRLAPQKGIDQFARLADEVGDRARFVWIGGGEEPLAAPLHAAGVEVTGWVSPADVEAALAQATLYVHTALWEGFPIALLEAVNLGVPSVVLDSPYAKELPSALRVSPEDAGRRVIELLADPTARGALVATGREGLAAHNPAHQRERLTALYDALRGSGDAPLQSSRESHLVVPASPAPVLASRRVAQGR